MREEVKVIEARRLYKAGCTKRAIGKTLGIHPGAILRWCNITPTYHNSYSHSHYYETLRDYWFNLDKVSLAKIDIDTCKILLSLLYWCEGGKYPSSNKVDFASSDEKMQVVFIQLLRKAFESDIVESKFRVWLQLHSTQNKEEVIKYWSKLLSIPVKQFIKPHITIPKGGKYRRVYNGTCSVRYNDYRVLLRIMGIYSRISNQLQSLDH